MLHVGKGLPGSFISLLSSSLEILYMQVSGTLSHALPTPGGKKRQKKRITVINLTASSQGKPKFSDIHNKLSSLQQQKLQVLHTELKSLALKSAHFPALPFP